MRIREMRKKARESLKGRWWQILPIALLIQIISIIFVYISTYLEGKIAISKWLGNDSMVMYVGYIATYIIYLCLTCILSYVFIGKTIKFNRGNEVTFSEYLSSVGTNAVKALKVSIFYIGYVLKSIWQPLVVLLLSIIFAAVIPVLIIVFYIAYVIAIVKGIEASYDYFLIYYLANDYEDKELKELFAKSKELMYGNRAKLIVLPITFIGWLILSVMPMVVFSEVISYMGNTNYALMSYIISSPMVLVVILQLLTLFVAPVTAYLLMTISNFYESFNPQEVFNEGYEKPEINSTKYVIFAFAIFLVPILLAFFMALSMPMVGI